MKNLGLAYIKVLETRDAAERIKYNAKIEKLEQRLLQQEKQSFFKYVIETDNNYKDVLFWLLENSKNETLESIQHWTLGWRVEMQYRIVKRIEDEIRRRNQGG